MSENVKKYKVCEYCNKMLNPLATVCPKCGHPHLKEETINLPSDEEMAEYYKKTCWRWKGEGEHPEAGVWVRCKVCGGIGKNPDYSS